MITRAGQQEDGNGNRRFDMGQQKLVKWLKLLVILAGLFGLFLCVIVLPLAGMNLAGEYPEFARGYMPWLVFLWILAAPCFAALFIAWKIFGNIEQDNSFCMDNSKYLMWIAYLAAGDSALIVTGNIVFLLISMNHPAVLLVSVLIAFIGIAVSVAAAVLSHLVRKAALLQEQSDLTI